MARGGGSKTRWGDRFLMMDGKAVPGDRLLLVLGIALPGIRAESHLGENARDFA